MRIFASRRALGALVAIVVASSLLSSVRAGEIEKYLPADTQMVISVNVKQIVESPLVKKDVGKMRQEVKKIDVAQKTLDDLGFDIFRDLDSITLASAGPAQFDRTLILAAGRFDLAKFRAKADEVAKEKNEMVKVIRDGDQIIYQTNIPDQGRTMFVALVDGSLLASAPTKAPVLEALAVKAGKKPSALKPEMKKLLDKADPTASISAFALGSALKGAPQSDLIKHFTGTIVMNEDVRAEVAIAAKDAEATKKLAQTLRGGIEQAKSFLAVMAANQKEVAPFTGVLDNFKVEEEGTTVTVKGSLSKEFLEQLNKKP